MTEPRRWPQKAEWVRQESLAKADRILEKAREAKRAILENRSNLTAISLLADIMMLARDIKEMMREVKRGRD